MKSIKHILLCVTSIILFLCCVPMMTYAAEGSLTGSGTESDPYLITSVNDMELIQAGIKDGTTYKGKYFSLTTDLTLPSDWEPLGTLKSGATPSGIAYGSIMLPFSGTINGNGHTLIFASGSRPLFGYVREASVENLNIYGSYIDGNGLLENYVVDWGKDNSNGTYDDPAFTISANNVTIKSGSKIHKSGFTGGYAGGLNHADFTDCSIEAGVSIGCNSDGSSAGLSEIGSFGGAINGTVSGCVSYATVYGSDNVGGIVGIRGQSTNTFTIENCVFHGAVKATGNRVGGILGSGYYMYNAPNAFAAVIKNCKVDGTVSGKDSVGGIFGAEAGIDQAWDNGIGRIVSNTFTGTVSGESRVGAIIGYIRALNTNNVISDNIFSSDCGTSKGIGEVTHVDTDAVEFGTHDGVFYFNTANFSTYNTEEWNQIYAVVDKDWEDTNRYAGKAIAKANYNRSDDPLGADLESLVKCSDDASEPICTSLDITKSDAFKDTYYVGDELDLNGLTFTAHWTDGKEDTTVDSADLMVSRFDSSTRGTKTIRFYYGAAVAGLNVNVIKDPSQKITVTFSIMGDSIHDSDEDHCVHVQSMGSLQTWVSPKQYTVSANANVKDVLELVLSQNDMSCANPAGNYVQSLTYKGVTLGEFDNGTNSGWMYTLNGTHPLFSVNQQYLEDGDVIVFHYTDNYYYEEGNTGYELAQNTLAAVEQINAIGKVSYTDASKKKIDAARTAYNALSADQKTLITPVQLKVLTDAETSYISLKTAAEKADTEKAATEKEAAEKAAAEKAAAEKKAAAAKAEAEKKALIKKYTPAKTAIKKLKKAGNGKIKITWKKVNAATGYQIYMSTKAKSGYSKIATISKKSKVTYTRKKLKKKKTYYFKVRTYRKVGKTTYYGSYSAVKKLKLK